jgi:hypothetical protein
MLRLSFMDNEHAEKTSSEKYRDEKQILEMKDKNSSEINWGLRELKATLGSLPAPLLALQLLHFTGGGERGATSIRYS